MNVLCWRLKISSDSWWLGVLSSQPSIYSNSYKVIDSLIDDPGDALLLGYSGCLSLNNSEVTHLVSVEKWCNPVVEVHCDPRSKTIFFISRSESISVGPIPFDIGFAKPVIQFVRTSITNSVTLESCDQNDAFGKPHICPISQPSYFPRMKKIRIPSIRGCWELRLVDQ